MKVYRLPPCPVCDVEGTESWLTELAEEGLLLESCFAGVAVFSRGEAREVRYRLEAAPRKAGLLTDDDEPDGEAVELGQAYGWEYVTRRGQFYIYRAEGTGTRELNTDTQVQALAIEAVRARERSSAATGVVWLLALLLLRGDLLGLTLALGTPLALFTAALLLWVLAVTISRVVRLGRLRRRLMAGVQPDHRKPWRRRAALYRVYVPVMAALWVLWAVLMLCHWSAEVLNEGEISIDEYGDTTPFATLADLTEGEYHRVDLGFTNTVEERSDWLAPRMVYWAEYGSDGTFSGGFHVDYFEMAATGLARELFWEMYRRDRRDKHFAPLEASLPEADQCEAYNATFPTLLLQKGSVVVRATLYQTGDNQIPLNEWIAVLAESVG